VEVHRRPVVARRPQRRGQRRGLVHHQQVAAPQEPREVEEARVGERLAVARDHQPDLVAREPARLRRLGRLERRRQRERRRRAHARASASAAAE
jgi:hypothetical protein